MADRQDNQTTNQQSGDGSNNSTSTVLKVILIILGVVAVLLLGIILGRAFPSGDYTDDPGSPSDPGIIPPVPEEGQAYVVATTYVNVRSGPGLEFEIYGILPPGQSAPVISLSQDGNWWEIVIPTAYSSSGNGWVSADYVILYNPSDQPIPQPLSSQ
jgi:uncharacterized protein YgiM (DUF1202 family)